MSLKGDGRKMKLNGFSSKFQQRNSELSSHPHTFPTNKGPLNSINSIFSLLLHFFPRFASTSRANDDLYCFFFVGKRAFFFLKEKTKF